ncbi:hypothetical protein BH10CYA1_BH10CYA1_15730 [soil metagenome]
MLEAPSGDFSTGTLFLERWGVKWSPNVESKLIDCNLYGDTIESAALAHFRELMAMEELNVGKASKLLVDAINMDLPNIVQEVEGVLGSAIDNDNRFASLAQALANLIVLERYGVYRDARKGIFDDLLERCFDRACFAVVEIITVPEDQQPAVVSGLLTVAEIVQRGDRPSLDKNLFVEHVRNAADACEVPFMRRVLLGILTEMRVNTTEDLAKELSALAHAPVEIMITAGDFLDGIMAASRTSIMLGTNSLIAAIDELLRAAEWDPFLTMVPKMRAAFERLHGSQLDNVADRYRPAYIGRWRLVLGKAAEQHGITCGGDDDCSSVAPLVGYLFGDDGESAGGGGAGSMGRRKTKERHGGRGRSELTVPDWVDQVTELFPNQAREVLEKELIHRRGLNEILQEPKLLEKIEPNIDIVKTLLTYKHLLNPDTRILARKLIDKVVSQVKDKLRLQIEQAITGAIRRDRHSPRKVYRNLDLKTTIRRNLHNYSAERKRLLVDRLYFFAAER